MKPQNPAAGGPSFDVFISYSNVDKAIANAICNHLEASGIRCWIAPRDITPGAEWGEGIIEGITRSTLMTLVFSKDSNDSPQVRREIERAVNKGLPIIPFRVQDLVPSRSLEYFLSSCHWLDAMSPPVEQHIQRLTEAIQALLQRPRSSPARTVAAPRTGGPQPAAVPSIAPPTGRKGGLGRWVFGAAAIAVLAVGTWLVAPYLFSKDDASSEAGPVDGVPPDDSGGGPDGSPSTSGSGQVATTAYRQDFQDLPVGELPAGWESDGSIQVVSGDGHAPRLEAAQEGQQQVTIPQLTAGDAFFLEVETEIGANHRLELTLESVGRGPNLTMAVTGDANFTAVELPNAEARTVPEVIFQKRGTLRLEREGNVVRALVNGRLVLAHRLAGPVGFGSLAIGMTGGVSTWDSVSRVYSVELGALTPSRPAPREGPAVPAPSAGPYTESLHEDFQQVTAGYLPPGWSGDDCVSVLPEGGARASVQVALPGTFRLETPQIRIQGDFVLETKFEIGLGHKLGVTLLGAGSKPDLTVTVSGDQSASTIGLPGGEELPVEAVAAMTPVTLRLEREGSVLRVSLGGVEVPVKPTVGQGDFEGVRFALDGGQTTWESRTRLHSLEVDPLDPPSSP